jgi:hypothetical protein
MNFHFRLTPITKPDTNWITQATIDQMLRRDAAELADALTREAELIRSEGNRADVDVADKLEGLALRLDSLSSHD